MEDTQRRNAFDRVKNTLCFSLICLVIVVALTVISFIVCELTPFLFNAHGILEYIGAGFVYVMMLFVVVLIGGIKWSNYYVPILYLVFSFLVLIDFFDGNELLYILYFGFSRVSFVLYESIQYFIHGSNWALNAFIFHGVFFLYQVGLLYMTKRLFRSFFKKMPLDTLN